MRRFPRPSDFELRLANRRALVPAIASLALAGLGVVVTVDVEAQSAGLAQTLGTIALTGLLINVLLGLEGGVVAATVAGLGAAMVIAAGSEEVAIVHLTAVGVLWFLAADGAIASIELRTVHQIPRRLVWPFLMDQLVVVLAAFGLAGLGGLLAGWGPGRSSVTATIGATVVLVVVALIARRPRPTAP